MLLVVVVEELPEPEGSAGSPEELPELLPEGDSVLVEELVVLVEPEFPAPELEPLVFDVEESELSCSAPLLTQPVIVTAISAQTTTEVISFFIYFPFPVQTIPVKSLSPESAHTKTAPLQATLIFYTIRVKNTIEKCDNNHKKNIVY